MTNVKILIAGDSFASDWTKKCPNAYGWPNMLADAFNVTNMAESGVSQYKIWQQIKNSNLNDFDICIVSHTSPYRVHTRKHPIHYNDILHKNADLMLNDIEYHKRKLSNIFNKSLNSAANWFKFHYDPSFQEEIYRLLRNDILRMLDKIKFIEIFNFEDNGSKFCYSKYLETDGGSNNHFNTRVNNIIFNDIKKEILRCVP